MSLNDRTEKTVQAIDLVARQLIHDLCYDDEPKTRLIQMQQRLAGPNAWAALNRARELTEQFAVHPAAYDAAVEYLKYEGQDS